MQKKRRRLVTLVADVFPKNNVKWKFLIYLVLLLGCIQLSTVFSAKNTTQEVTTREVTLSDFNLQPYLPKNPGSPLARILKQADHLTQLQTSTTPPEK